ncbi:TraB/GumN family protein [Brevundimonas abyssalis]|nr:TraB/GumN family protein [Brevundimonas abyssalis]
MLAISIVPSKAAAQAGEASVVEEIVITARRADAPIWEITVGDGSLILVGAISGVPRDLPWRPEALEAATRRSDRILFPQIGQASPADVMRLIWRSRTITRLPDGTTTADYLPPEVQERLEVVMEGDSDRWRRESLVMLGLNLITDKTGHQRRRTRGAVEVIEDAARQADVPVRRVGVLRGDALVENLITQPPETYLACIEAAVSAAEAGPEGAARRIEAWRGRRVPDVLAEPLDEALNLCWPSGDPDVAPLLRAQWAEAIEAALDEPGVTLAVAQLRLLAEPGGVLDMLEARGFDIVGPRWRAE